MTETIYINFTKKYIKQKIGSIHLDDFHEESFDSIISQLNDKSKKAESEFPSMRYIYLDKIYDRCDETYYFNVMIERLETDKEYDNRIKEEKKEQERKAKVAAREKTKLEKFEQKEYLRLQKKFGNKV
jgi:hypothetical protein